MANLTNREVAALLTEFARRAKPGTANPYPVRAYLHAAKSLMNSPTPIDQLIAKDQLRQLPGVGITIARTITVLHETGTHPALENMRARQTQQKD